MAKAADHPITPLRAFLYFDAVPPGCGLLPIRDDRCAPHLDEGEIAVVDYADRAVALGEIVCIAQSNGPMLWEILREPWPETIRGDGGPYFRLCPPNRPRSAEEARADLMRGRARLSEGPISEANLAPMILGRVIGIYDPKRAVPEPILPALPAPNQAGGAP